MASLGHGRISLRRALLAAGVVFLAFYVRRLPDVDSVAAGKIQAPGLTLPPDAAANAASVKAAFKSAFRDYATYAYGHDDLAPLSKSYVDSRNGWGATIVDALGTMKIMGLDEEFAYSVNYTSHIDFSRSKTYDFVSLFETNIRYLGGMLSAYELNGKQDAALLEQAITLGDKLSYGWVGNNTIPFNRLDFTSNTPLPDINNIAQAGTLVLEFGKLSQHSGNPKYKNLAEQAMRQIATLTPPLPGLASQGIDPSTNRFVGDYISWGGGSDSYFEYLIKYSRLTNFADPLWVETWKTAVDSSIKYLLTTSSVGNWTYLTDHTGGRNRFIGSHLGCFVGGNWIMGGKLLNNKTILDYGLSLTDACINTYTSDVTGIGPEVFAYTGVGTVSGNWTGGGEPSAFDQAFYNEHGFYVYNNYSFYDLRPEVLESNFYAWRATGDVKYQKNAAAALQSILKNCKAPLAFAPIINVQKLDSGFIDDTESFFFAEVMKYLYLTFDDPNHISLDKWVFNTEAHPLLAPAGLPAYKVSQGAKQSPLLTRAADEGNLPQISENPRLPKPLRDVIEEAAT
ncbi:glycoside hydrolase family 47 protein [Cantharellus anzutake]|uniref:glycoside hydrolase family 47 protein n=1 Tax=Cantharellus anzutake TaxID=1750568 RepID=UPI0019085731|nr:glycoside hydrolase family 47 protein [Cantharellus anzutake]KAF8342750.1 glycoside hydrolase family 47 protein [Cantharellus anzutake]